MRTDIAILALAVVSFLCLVALYDDSRDLEVEQYCEMRAIWKNSDGEYGWPEGAGGLSYEVCK